MKRVQKGPDIESKMSPTAIDGALLMQAPTVAYEHGHLTEILNPKWETIYSEEIVHMYVITNKGHSREEWHVHEESIDRYFLIHGEIQVALYDAREQSPSHGVLEILTLSAYGESGYQGLRIPAGVYHTFQSRAGGFTLLNNKSIPYNREKPDKFVVSFEESEVDFNW